MKKLMSTNYSTAAFNIATLFLRVAFGILMFLNHGLVKLNKFSEWQSMIPDPFHIGHRFSLILVIFAEVFCSLLLVIGLFSRFAAFVLLLDVGVAIFLVHLGQPIEKFELAILHATVYFSLLLIGPGKISVDGMAGK